MYRTPLVYISKQLLLAAVGGRVHFKGGGGGGAWGRLPAEHPGLGIQIHKERGRTQISP